MSFEVVGGGCARPAFTRNVAKAGLTPARVAVGISVMGFALPTGLIAVAFVFFWNSGFVGAEIALPRSAPFTLLFWRYWGLALALLLYLAWRRRLVWPGWQSGSYQAIIGMLAHGVWLGCVFVALQGGVPAGIVALVVALQPMATGALSGLFTGEAVGLRRWLGLLTGFAGVVVAVGARTDFQDLQSIWVSVVPFGSVVAITLASLLQRRVELQQAARRLPIDAALFYQSVGVALATTLPAIFLENLETAWDFEFIASMAWLVFAVSLLAYGLMWMLLARIDATRVASLFYLGPPVTMIMAWAAFGDTVNATDLAGLVIVAVGVGITFTGARKAESPQATP